METNFVHRKQKKKTKQNTQWIKINCVTLIWVELKFCWPLLCQRLLARVRETKSKQNTKKKQNKWKWLWIKVLKNAKLRDCFYSILDGMAWNLLWNTRNFLVYNFAIATTMNMHFAFVFRVEPWSASFFDSIVGMNIWNLTKKREKKNWERKCKFHSGNTSEERK